MSNFDHDAIYRAHPNVKRIDDASGAFDKDGNKVTLVQSSIDAARVTLNDEASAIKYKGDRTGLNETSDTVYPSIGDQLDLIYKDIVAGTITASGNFATRIKATKDKYPKP